MAALGKAPSWRDCTFDTRTSITGPMLVQIQHQANICTIHEIGERNQQPFFAMEFMDGATRNHRISGKLLPLEQLPVMA